jgi:HK97 gp10 family phage protein
MAKVTVKVAGLRELDEALGELPKSTAKNVLKRTLTKAGTPIEQAAEREAPVRTGRLKRGVMTGTKLTKRQRRQAERAGFVEVFVGVEALAQATMQEFGTHNQPPQPYIRPAWDAHQTAALNIIASDLGNEIERAAQRLARKAARAAAKAV